MVPVTEHTLRLAYRISGDFFAVNLDRDDLAQEALIGALQARRSYNPAMGAWVPFEWSCMRRRCIDAVRKSRPASEFLTDDLSAPEDLSLEAREALAAVRGLPLDQQRVVISLALGLSYAEIADAEGWSVKWVDKKVQLARVALRSVTV